MDNKVHIPEILFSLKIRNEIRDFVMIKQLEKALRVFKYSDYYMGFHESMVIKFTEEIIDIEHEVVNDIVLIDKV